MSKYYILKGLSNTLYWFETNFKTKESNLENNMEKFKEISYLKFHDYVKEKRKISIKLNKMFYDVLDNNDAKKQYNLEIFKNLFYNHGCKIEEFRDKYIRESYLYYSEKQKNNIHYEELINFLNENHIIEDVIYIYNKKYKRSKRNGKIKKTFLFYDEYDIFDFLKQVKKDKYFIDSRFQFEISGKTLICLDSECI